MIEISQDERKRAFSVWLRTGRITGVRRDDGLELKFNPWHDPEDGRFTFAGTGRRYGQGGGESYRHDEAAWQGRESRKTRAQADRQRSPGNPRTGQQAATPRPRASLSDTGDLKHISRGGWRGGGFTGGGGGSFGGAGAQNNEPWGDAPKKQPSASVPATARHQSAPTRSLQRAVTAEVPPQLHNEVRNGYQYQIDPAGRTRRVSGALTLADRNVRSRSAQARAGGAERRASDDGGHYIAARFNGPTEAFNHFAQDARVNRGRYRALEDQWARAKRAGKSVRVKIVPHFVDRATRPFEIDVMFAIDGGENSVKIPNEQLEKPHGKR